MDLIQIYAVGMLSLHLAMTGITLSIVDSKAFLQVLTNLSLAIPMYGRIFGWW